MNEFDFRSAREAIYESALGLHASSVLLQIVEHQPNCRPSVDRISRRSKVCRRQVIEELSWLEEHGLIVVSRTHGVRNNYTLPDGWLAKLPAHGNQCTPCTSAPHAPVHPMHPTSAPHAPVPVHPMHPKQEDKQKDKQEGSRSRRSRLPTAGSNSTKERKPTHPGHAELVACYFEAFEKRRGTKPIFAGAEGTAVTRLLAAVGDDVAKAKVIISNALASWQGDSITIRQIASDPSKWLTAAPAKAGRPAMPVQQGFADGVVIDETPAWERKAAGGSK